MSIYSLPPLISSVLVLFVGAFVFFNNRKSMTNITFCLTCLSVFLWLFGYSMMYLTRNEAFAFGCAKFVYTGVVFIPTFVYHFSISFLHVGKEQRKVVIFFLCIWFCIFYLLILFKFIHNRALWILLGISNQGNFKQNSWSLFTIVCIIFFTKLHRAHNSI